MSMQVLVIGASRGIGLEFVRQYHADGAQLTATARDQPGLDRLRSLGASALSLDVTDAASCSGLAAQLDGSAFDVVIFNAGVYGPQTTGIEVPSQDDFDAVMHTNVLGAMRVLPQLEGALAPNRLVIRLQPQETITLELMSKRPGLNQVQLQPVALNISSRALVYSSHRL